MDMAFMSLSRMAFGYWEGQPLFALAELGIPDLLAKGGLTAAEIADAVDASADATVRLLDASVALKVLERRDGRYSNSGLAHRFLTTDGEHSLLHWVRVMGRWSGPWAKLTESIRSGFASEPQADRLGGDARYMRDFILGMHEYARRSSDSLVPFIDPKAHTLIDVGGGAGTYAIAVCRAIPALHAEVLDLEPVLAITREIVEKEGLLGRIVTRVANYRRDPIGRDCDVVLLSNVLHQEGADVCVSILQRAHAALRSNGSVLVQGYFLNDDRLSPTFVTLHNLSALTLWEGGRSWTAAEMTELIRGAGFAEVQVAPSTSSGLTVISALKT